MHDINLDFEEATLHGVSGPPGSGKTLLLHLLGLLEEPDFGSVELFGQPVSPAPEETRREIRNTVFGYVFPSPCLLPAFTAAENIAMPLFRISGADEHAARERVAELLDLLGIEHTANHLTSTLDADLQFLTALARAIVHRPRILFLLAPGRASTLAPYVRRLVSELRITAIWAGQKDSWLCACDRTIMLEVGAVAEDSTICP